ncbi:MAG: choice-of-anchor tandem repeat NxxGxxAF-containing protein [Pseudomonadota bacterium]
MHTLARSAGALSLILLTFGSGSALAATYTFDALIKTFDAPPELGELEYRATSGAPTINNSLQAVGTSLLLPISPSAAGFRILSFDGAQFSTPVEAGAPVPGVSGAAIDLVPTEPIVNQGGDVLFLSALSGSGATTPANAGLFRLRNGTLETLVRGGDVVDGVEIQPTTITSSTNNIFGAINATGQVAFQALFDDGVSVRGGIFREGPGGFSLVAEQGQLIPSAGGARIGPPVGQVSIADDGSVFFLAGLLGQNGANQGAAVFKEQDGEVTVLVAPGQTVDGAQPLDFFSRVSEVNGAGDVAIQLSSGQDGILKSVDGELSAVALPGDFVAGIEGPLRFFSNASINASGDVAFYATPRDNSACGGSQECGIFAEMGGELGLVAQRGDTIEIAPGDFRTISGLVVNSRGGFLNDLGQVAFLAFFNSIDNPGLGDTQAWIVATPENLAPIPLPDTLSLLIVGALGFGFLRGRSGVRKTGYIADPSLSNGMKTMRSKSRPMLS